MCVCVCSCVREKTCVVPAVFLYHCNLAMMSVQLCMCVCMCVHLYLQYSSSGTKKMLSYGVHTRMIHTDTIARIGIAMVYVVAADIVVVQMWNASLQEDSVGGGCVVTCMITHPHTNKILSCEKQHQHPPPLELVDAPLRKR